MDAHPSHKPTPKAFAAGWPITIRPQHACRETLDFIQVPGFPSASHAFTFTHSRPKVVQR